MWKLNSCGHQPQSLNLFDCDDKTLNSNSLHSSTSSSSEIVYLKLHINLTTLPSQVRELTHQNLNPYIGSCVEVPDNFFLASVYFRKGSLQDVLSDSNLKLDDMFKMSFIFDICKVGFAFWNFHSALYFQIFVICKVGFISQTMPLSTKRLSIISLIEIPLGMVIWNLFKLYFCRVCKQSITPQ